MPPRAKSTLILWLRSTLFPTSCPSSRMSPPLLQPHQRSPKTRTEKQKMAAPVLLEALLCTRCPCPPATQPLLTYRSSPQLTPPRLSSDTSPWMMTVRWIIPHWEDLYYSFRFSVLRFDENSTVSHAQDSELSSVRFVLCLFFKRLATRKWELNLALPKDLCWLWGFSCFPKKF